MVLTIGIKRESRHPNEQRVVLTPNHVKKLINEHNIDVVVQSSEKRAFKDEEYVEVGAKISDNLSDCNLIFGVKEISEDELTPNKTHLFFSHTIKGQKYNMPMLKKILDNKITLIDYELIKRDNGRRVAFFGTYAGYVGMINSLWTYGRRLEVEGIENPFKDLKQTCKHEGLSEIKPIIKQIGKKIKTEGLPEQLTPFVVGFTGFGRVSKAAQEIIRILPIKKIKADELPTFFNEKKFSNKVVYSVEFKLSDLFMKIKDGKYSKYLYFKHPERFTSKLEKYVPYLSILVNGIYWEPKFPRLITLDYMKKVYESNPTHRLKVIADISCDIDGSIELTTKSTSSENPVYVYEPLTGKVIDGVKGNGPVILAQDKLPLELPKDSSEQFGDSLMPYIPQLVKVDYSKPRHELDIPKVFKKAVLAHQGELHDKYKQLYEHLN